MIGSRKPLPGGKDLKSTQVDIHQVLKGQSQFSLFLSSLKYTMYLFKSDREKKFI